MPTAQQRPRPARATLLAVPPLPLRALPLAAVGVPDDTVAFAPPPRFGAATFERYRPQHPSQQRARDLLAAFVLEPAAKGRRRWPWATRRAPPGRGLYLDGGFGVGKTHLLAAAFHASPETAKAYLSFQELVYYVGVQGVAAAKAELAELRLLCLDEFELDDPGNTLIVKTLLAHLFAGGTRVITTSNTPPEAQGQGRFNAGDFQREIQSIAAHFEVVPIDGPDFRLGQRRGRLLRPHELQRQLEHEAMPAPKVVGTWRELQQLLAAHHPIHYRRLLAGVGTLYLHEAAVLPTQHQALHFVHFIDKLYDQQVGLRVAGSLALDELFDASYRHSAYARKHERCLSRLAELLGERPLEDATSRAATGALEQAAD